jgi:hypothetical protein
VEFDTQVELDAWIEANHLDKILDPKVADDMKKKKK